jgi:DNA polymerase elongation subunit (family B)
MAERDIGNAPQLNDRIPYVYIFKTKEETKNMLNEINKDIVEKTKKRKKLLQGDLIETPDYVLEHKLPIDYLFYLTNQLTNPLSQLFAIFENVDGDIDTKEKAFKKRVIKPLEQRYKNTQNCVKTIDMFFTPLKI